MAVPEDTGYPLRWFKEQNYVRNLYECGICLEVMKDAVQIRDCGHQFCRYCLDGVLRSNVHPQCPKCRIQITNQVVFSDNAAMRQIGNLAINCPNNGCEWDGTLNSLLQRHIGICPFLLLRCRHRGCDEQVTRGNLAAHHTKCEYRMVTCFYCKSDHILKDKDKHLKECLILPVRCTKGCPQTIPRNKMQEHFQTVCIKTVVKCKYSDFGCEYQCERQELEEHLNQGMKHHLELSTLEISRLKVKCGQNEKDNREIKEKHDEDMQEMKKKCEEYEENMEVMKQKCGQNEKDNREIKQKCAQNEKDKEVMKQKHEKDIQEMKKKHEKDIQGMEQKCARHEKDKEEVKQKCVQYEKDIHGIKQKVNTALHLMIIRDFNKKLLEAKIGNSYGWIESDPFYSSPDGYKMKLIVQLNETRQEFKDHIGVYLSIMKSDHDAILSWPFKEKYTFTLFDQQDDEKERENIVHTITPAGQDNFKRPVLDESLGCGRAKFVSHETLQTREYVKDNTVFIKFSIET